MVDPGLWRYEPRVGGQRLAAQSGFAPVQELLHGIAGGCSDVGPSDQERAAWAAQDGGQFPQVINLWSFYLTLVCVLRPFIIFDVPGVRVERPNEFR